VARDQNGVKFVVKGKWCDVHLCTSPDCDETVKGLSLWYSDHGLLNLDASITYPGPFPMIYRLGVNKLQPGDHWTDKTIKSFNVTCWEMDWLLREKLIWPPKKDKRKEKKTKKTTEPFCCLTRELLGSSHAQQHYPGGIWAYLRNIPP
jgi:hypothetical protein